MAAAPSLRLQQSPGWNLSQDPTKTFHWKGGFPCATTWGMAEEERFYTVRTYHHVSCLGCKILAFFFTISDQLQCSSSILHFAVRKKRNKSMGHKASLDILVSFLSGSSCKNQFHTAFSSPNLPCSAKFPWKWGFKIPHCQSPTFLYQFLPNKFQIPYSFSAKSDRMVGAGWVRIGMQSQCGKGCSINPSHTSEDINRRLMKTTGTRGEICSLEVCGKQDSVGCALHELLVLGNMGFDLSLVFM